MAEIQDIDGVGPAREESIEEAGYESIGEVADADHEELADKIGVSEDHALEFIVQAQNIIEGEQADSDEIADDEFDLRPSELAEEREEEKEDEPEIEDEGEIPDEPEIEDEHDQGRGPYHIEITFDNKRQYDTFHAALMRRHEAIYTGNQPAADALQKCLNGLDNFEKVEYELSEYELNELHSAVTQQRTNYQGENLIEHMDELQEIQNQIDELRDEYLF